MYPDKFKAAKGSLGLNYADIKALYNAIDFYGVSAYSGLRCERPGREASGSTSHLSRWPAQPQMVLDVARGAIAQRRA